MITNGLPQEVETSQYGCGALRTLQKTKFYKDTLVYMHVCTYVRKFFLGFFLSTSFVVLSCTVFVVIVHTEEEACIPSIPPGITRDTIHCQPLG